MIGRLKGTLETKNPPFLLIDVNGVGYEVQAPLSTIYQLPALNQSVTLLTHLHVREDAQILYGFYEEKERALFRALIKISGVGPKMALTILSGIDVAQFIHCVEHRDSAPLVKLSGVGKKTAERLIIEMAGKLKTSFEEEFELASKIFGTSDVDNKAAKGLNLPSPQAAEQEAISALIALGYKPQEASRAVANVANAMNSEENSKGKGRNSLKNTTKLAEDSEYIITSQELIRRALKQNVV